MLIDVASPGNTPKDILMGAFRIFVGDGDGVIGMNEMTMTARVITDTLAAAAGIVKTAQVEAEKRAENILKQVMGEINDSNLTEEEFLHRFLQNDELSNMLM